MLLVGRWFVLTDTWRDQPGFKYWYIRSYVLSTYYEHYGAL